MVQSFQNGQSAHSCRSIPWRSKIVTRLSWKAALLAGLAGALFLFAAARPLEFEHGQRQILALRIVRIADAFGHRADVLHSAAWNR